MVYIGSIAAGLKSSFAPVERKPLYAHSETGLNFSYISHHPTLLPYQLVSACSDENGI